jgi:hypothetical protein
VIKGLSDAPKGTLAHDVDMLAVALLRFRVAVRPQLPTLLAGYILLVGAAAAGAYLLDTLP